MNCYSPQLLVEFFPFAAAMVSLLAQGKKPEAFWVSFL
jgi:hypothetical protein